MLLPVAREAWLSVLENKRKNMFFIIFISMTMAAACIISSAIFSVRMQAEKELRITGNNIITVHPDQALSASTSGKIAQHMEQRFSAHTGRLKQIFISSGNSPWANEKNLISGIDNNWLTTVPDSTVRSLNGVSRLTELHDNHSQSRYINHIPFRLAGNYRIQTTSFLSSLGLAGGEQYREIYIPLETAIRYSKDNSIDKLRIIFPHPVTANDVDLVREYLSQEITNFTLTSVLSARLAVDKVISNFHLLYSSVYFILLSVNILVAFSTVRKNFTERKTELSLKIIYGFPPGRIFAQFIAESALLNLMVLLLSSMLSVAVLYTVFSFWLKTPFFFSPGLLLVISLLTLASCCLSCLLYSLRLKTISPVKLLKEIIH